MDSLSHVKCINCRSVTLRKSHRSRWKGKQYTCDQCNVLCFPEVSLPIWFDENNNVQYHVPAELAVLREGEKLLIQQVSVYVPLQHLMYGQVGARGHIVSFPQDVSSVCKTLPRLPDNVQVVRVIKNFRLNDGTISSKTFSIRRPVVMAALHWLKKFNKQYNEIDICEANLSWITNGVEQELPIQSWEEPDDPASLPGSHNEDLGPSPQQIADQVLGQDEPIEPCFGICTECYANKPKQKDKSVVDALISAEMQGKLLTIDSDGSAVHFPYVSPDPVCEYSEMYLMEYAFPWLFPGGSGGYMSGRNPKPNLKVWLKMMTLYMDGRFDHDRLWAFFALNYYTRHQNQSSGGFYVKTFFENGPKTLEQIQKQISEGHLEWLDRITYFSQCVTGSSAYWRARRREVFAWISYHVEKGNGVPTFFITLSCAEYHWADIERLIIDKCHVSGIDLPDFTKGKSTIRWRDLLLRSLQQVQISMDLLSE
jgi:Helitron helicase-like domain at N-terminus